MTLIDRLNPVAVRASKLAHRFLRTRESLTGDRLAAFDYFCHAQSAAFEAFVALGGDVDNDAAFDFAGRQEELVKETTRLLRRELFGRKSVYGDTVTRLQPRQDQAILEQKTWTSWTNSGSEPLVIDNSGRLSQERAGAGYAMMVLSADRTEQETRLYEQELLGLRDALRNVLSKNEYRWLTERYLDGLSQYEQIAALVAENPKYQGDRGAERAENYINVTVHRARKRAAAMLGPKWSSLVAEAVA